MNELEAQGSKASQETLLVDRAAGEGPGAGASPAVRQAGRFQRLCRPLLSTVHCSWGHQSYPGPTPCGDRAQALKAIGLQTRSNLPRPWGLR